MHFSKILQIFGGLVLGCIKTKFCKKICVWQHFSSSTRFASFCTAAISKFSQKIGLKNQQFSWKFNKNSANVAKFAKFCQISKISAWESGRFWKMLQNAYLLAKIGADTAENEQHFAEILPTDALWRLCRLRLWRWRHDLAVAHGDLGNAGKERDLLARALRIKERHYGPDHVEVPNRFSKMHFSKMHFSKMHFSKILQIFGGLVLGCIKTKFCKKICVRQHFSSSTRFASFCTAAISKFSQKIGLKKQQFSWNFSKKLQMSQNLQNVVKFQKFQLDNLVDFEKCCKTRIHLQRSAPIQPKTSEILPKLCQKFATTLPKFAKICHPLRRPPGSASRSAWAFPSSPTPWASRPRCPGGTRLPRGTAGNPRCPPRTLKSVMFPSFFSRALAWREPPKATKI